MVDKKGFEIISCFWIEKDFSKPIDCRNFIAVSVQGSAFVSEDEQGVAGDAIDRFNPTSPALEFLKTFKVERLCGASGSPLTKSKIEEVANRLGKRKINSKNDE